MRFRLSGHALLAVVLTACFLVSSIRATAQSRTPGHGAASARKPGAGHISHSWSQYRGNAANNCLGAGSGCSGKLSWMFSFRDKGLGDAPSVGPDGTVYACENGEDEVEPFTPSYLFALDPANGTVRWRYTFPEHFSSCPAVGPDGALYVVTMGNVLRNDLLIALDRRTGRKRWAVPAPNGLDFHGELAIGPTGIIYFCYYRDSTPQLVAFSPDDGHIIWSRSGIKEVKPAVGHDGTVFACFQQTDSAGSAIGQPALLALDGLTDKTKWTMPLEGPREDPMVGTDQDPMVGTDGTVYIANSGQAGAHYLYALNPETGSKKWTYVSFSHPIRLLAVTPKGDVYILRDTEQTRRSSISVISAVSGKEKRVFFLPATFYFFKTLAVDAGGTLYVPCSDHRLYAVDGQSGDVKWSTALTGDPGCPAVGPGRGVYVVEMDTRGNTHLCALR